MFMKTFNAIIVDKETESAKLLADMLCNFVNIKIISIEKDSSIALSKILHLKPDLLFLGIEMPVLNGFDIIHRLKGNMFFPKIVLMSNQCQYGIKAIKEGVFDYLHKPYDFLEIKECIVRLESESNCYLEELSDKEKEIMYLLCQGWPVKQISDNLNLSPHTISYHRKKILKKSGVKSTAQLLSRAV